MTCGSTYVKETQHVYVDTHFNTTLLNIAESSNRMEQLQINKEIKHPIHMGTGYYSGIHYF